ncbi:MAG TPA: hypothetical protein P5079_11395, partial [Elusimicrobiota bacterium]|nr:hypothetical protein [Elusimicrobiota bacterium]
HMGRLDFDPLVKDPTLMGLVPRGRWGELLQRDDDVREENLLRYIRSGRPAGDVGFVKKMEHLTGRKLACGRAGRPVKKKSNK